MEKLCFPLEEIWKLKTTILVAKEKKLVTINTCNYKPCSHFGQMTKGN
jgi:hypothetical protein